MNNTPWRYRAPKLSGRKAAALDSIIAAVAKAAEATAKNPNLSETGKKGAFTEAVRGPLMELRRREGELRDEFRKIHKERLKLQQEKEPAPISSADRQELYEMIRMARESPERMNYLFKVVGARNPDQHERRLQFAFLTVSPHLLGDAMSAARAKQEQTLLRLNLGIEDLGYEGDALDSRESSATDELEDLRSLRVAIAQVSDREALVKGGFLETPMIERPVEERVAFIQKHGEREYARVLMEEISYGASAAHEKITSSAFMSEPEPAPAA